VRAALALGIAAAAIFGGVAAAQEKPRSLESIECSRQADLQRLHGVERRDFRTKCMGTAAQPQPAQTAASQAPAADEGIKALSREELTAVVKAIRARLNSHGYVGDPIDVNVYLNPDGTLAKAPEIVSKPSNDPNYQAAVKALKQAVVQSQPFSMLKKESYAHWKFLPITFDFQHQ
jgi:hypothetical protein